MTVPNEEPEDKTFWQKLTSNLTSLPAAGLLGGGLIHASKPEEGKEWDDMAWYEKAALTVGSKLEGLQEGVAGFFGLEDYVDTSLSDTLETSKFGPEKFVGTSLQTGGNISGEGVSRQPGGQGAAGTSSSGTSLGRQLALEEEPALENDNINENNFNF